MLFSTLPLGGGAQLFLFRFTFLFVLSGVDAADRPRFAKTRLQSLASELLFVQHVCVSVCACARACAHLQLDMQQHVAGRLTSFQVKFVCSQQLSHGTIDGLNQRFSS